MWDGRKVALEMPPSSVNQEMCAMSVWVHVTHQSYAFFETNPRASFLKWLMQIALDFYLKENSTLKHLYINIYNQYMILKSYPQFY